MKVERRIHYYFVIFFLLSPLISFAVDEEVGEKELESFQRFSWDRGLDYAFLRPGIIYAQPEPQTPFLTGHLGAVLNFDAAYAAPTSIDFSSQEDFNVRRARLRSVGTFHFERPITYKLQLGYESTKWVVHDAALTFYSVPLVNSFQFGYYKNPMTFSGATSGRDLPMMERPPVINAFWDNRSLGASFGGTERTGPLYWKAGVFAFGEDFDDSSFESDNLKFVTRIAGRPYKEKEAEWAPELMHLGFNAQFEYAADSDQGFSARPQNQEAPPLVDTGVIDSDQSYFAGFEFAAKDGPMSFESELMYARVDAAEGNLNFWGAYTTSGWMLTGETKPYNINSAVFGKVIPETPFAPLKGDFGALELVFEGSYLDLRDDFVDGGTMLLFGAGIKSYINQIAQLHFNTTYTDVDGGTTPGGLWVFQTRLQFWF